jgi:hypothetical protein
MDLTGLTLARRPIRPNVRGRVRQGQRGLTMPLSLLCDNCAPGVT